MNMCRNCGKENDQDARFCEYCGKPIDAVSENKEEVLENNAEESNVLNEQQTTVESTDDTLAVEADKAEEKAKESLLKKVPTIHNVKIPKLSVDLLKTKKALYICAASVVVALIAVLLLFAKSPDPMIYVRDSQLVMRKNAETTLIHDEFSEGYVVSDYMSPDTLVELMALSADDRYLYYLTDYDSGYDLYSYDLKKGEKQEPIKISNSVSKIYVPEDGKGVYYLKNVNGYSGKLYYYDQNSSGLIAKDVMVDSIVAVGKNIAYLDENPDTGVQSLYLYNLKDQEEYKVDTNVSMLYDISLSGKPSDIVYGKNGESYGVESVYVAGYEVEKEKLVNNSSILAADADTIFYYADKDGKCALYQYNVDTREGVKLCADVGKCFMLSADAVEYYDNVEKTYFVSFSNGIRIESIGVCIGALVNEDKSAIVLLEYENLQKVDFADGTEDFAISVYSIKDGVLSEKHVLSEDASKYCYYDAKHDVVYYFEGVDKNMHGTLFRYVNGEKERVADDVCVEMIGMNTKTADIVYFADVVDGVGTMYLYDGKKPVRVGSDVQYDKWEYVDNNNLLYLANWDMANGGEFYRFSGKKAERIASDVQMFFSIPSADRFGLAYIADSYMR